MKQKLLALSLFVFGVLVGLLFSTTTYVYRAGETKIQEVREGDYVDGLGTLKPDGCFDLILQ